MKKIHTNSKIFFPNPKVVMIEYDINSSDVNKSFSDLCRTTYKLIKGTWGHSPLYTEQIRTYSYNNTEYINYIQRAYFVFEDELDELQFSLMSNSGLKKVKLWPKRTLFTIHEYCTK